MPKLLIAVPKYRKHRASGQAVVSLGGRTIYLGPHGTKTSHDEVDRVVGEWLQRGRTPPRELTEIVVAEVAAAYKQFAKTYYVKGGKITREYGCIDDAVKILTRLYGRRPTSEFGPITLQSVRQFMID